MNRFTRQLPSWLAPVLGAGAIGVCPLCWAGSAALLTYLGLAALIPLWQGIVFIFLGLGLIGFIFDYRSHHNIYPIFVLLLGSILLYLGRYVFGGQGFSGWPIWGLGGALILLAVAYNKYQFKKSTLINNKTEQYE